MSGDHLSDVIDCVSLHCTWTAARLQNFVMRKITG
jgi:hypothetical protein